VISAVTLNSVTKSYPEFALGPISLEIERGTSLAIIGPNGAGKSTLMDMIAGISDPSSGDVAILGKALDTNPEQKTHIGFASEDRPFYENLSGMQNLRFLSTFFGTWSNEEAQRLAAHLELPLQKKVRHLSKGNRVKLALVAALAHSPNVLLLDEPTAGLDPLVRADLLDSLWNRMTEGEPTIIYSTHILSDVDRIADEVVFVRDGRIILRDSTESLKEAWGAVTFRFEDADLPKDLLSAGMQHKTDGTRHVLTSPDARATVERLGSLGATDIEVQKLSLEQISINILRSGSKRAATTRINEGSFANA